MSDQETNITPQPSTNEAVVDQPTKGRLAEAAAKVRAMVQRQPEMADPAPTPEPETSEPTPEPVAETAPEPTPEPAKEPEHRLKPSQLREMERRQRAAERHRVEAERMFQEAQSLRQQMAQERQRIDADRQRIEKEREDLKRWDEEARRSPLQKMAERWGMKPEELAASFADDKASALSPEIAARFNEFQMRIETEAKERQRLETELKTEREKAREAWEQRQREQNLNHDVRMVSHEVLQESGDQFPHFAALPEQTRQQRARYMVLAASEMMRKTGDEYNYHDVLEILEDQAKQEWDSMSKNERLRNKYQPAPATTKPSGGSVPSKTAARAPSARDAAVPGEPRETTQAERRAAAARKLKELRGS